MGSSDVNSEGALPYYQDRLVTIYHGDCREVMGDLGNFDLLLTDPPYGVSLGEHSGGKETRRGLLVKRGGYEDSSEHYRGVIVPAIDVGLGKCKRGMVFGVPPLIWEVPPPDVMGGIFIPGACGRNKWGWSNFIHVLFYGSAPGLNRGAKPTAIMSNATADKSGHPTPKPMVWLNWAVSLGSEEGEVILDPFAGSGTTGRAAKDLGRKAVLIEIEEGYCEIAAKRTAQEVLF